MSDAPERISMVRDILGGWGLSYPHERDGTETPYILAEPSALAASPEVQALIREAEARGMEQAYRKACVAVQIVISRNTPDDGGDADPCLVDQLEAVESLIKREAAAIRGEGK